MNYEPTLAISGFSTFSVQVSDEAQKRKADALELAATVKTVGNREEQQDAIAAAALLKALVKGCEAARVEINKPILAAKREADDAAKIYSGTIIRELARIEKLASDYQMEENRKAEAIRAEQERQNRAAAEAADAERRAFLKAIDGAGDDMTREAMQKAADEAREANAEAARARQQALVSIAPQKTEGARVIESWDFEVLDIRLLAQSHPELVTIEPKTALIKAALKLGQTVSGIRAWQTTAVQSKAASL